MSINNLAAVRLALPEQNIDKLVSLYQGSFPTVAASTTTYSFTITPQQAVACLPELLWSTDGGTTWLLGGMQQNGNLAVTVGLSGTTAKLYAGYYNFTGGPDTITYKLYLVWPH